MPLDDSLEREGNLLLLVGAVDASYIPGVATTAGQHHIVGRIAANKAGLIPNSGQLTEEFLHLVGLCVVALGLVGQMLQGRFVEHGKRQLVGIRGDMRMLRVGEGARRVVHRSDDIAGEGQRGVMGSRLLGERTYVVVPLGTIHGLGGEQVGIGALPAAGDGGTVEVDQQMMLGRTLQEIDAVVHVHLVIAREEIDFHTSYTNLLAPGELLFAVLGLVESVLRRGSTINPAHRRVVPDEGFDAFRLGIVHRILNGIAVFHGVPLGIDEHIGKMQFDRHIDVFLDDVIVVRAMVIGPVDPRHHAGMNPVDIVELTGFGDVGDEG